VNLKVASDHGMVVLVFFVNEVKNPFKVLKPVFMAYAVQK